MISHEVRTIMPVRETKIEWLRVVNAMDLFRGEICLTPGHSAWDAPPSGRLGPVISSSAGLGRVVRCQERILYSKVCMKAKSIYPRMVNAEFSWPREPVLVAHQHSRGLVGASVLLSRQFLACISVQSSVMFSLAP